MTFEDMKRHLRVDHDEEDQDIVDAIEESIEFMHGETGKFIKTITDETTGLVTTKFKDLEELTALERRAIKLLVGHWFEYRGVIGQINENDLLNYSLKSISIKLQYC